MTQNRLAVAATKMDTAVKAQVSQAITIEGYCRSDIRAQMAGVKQAKAPEGVKIGAYTIRNCRQLRRRARESSEARREPSRDSSIPLCRC